MTEQSKIPVGSKITTRKEYPAYIVAGRKIYGYLPAGATGKVVGHTADGRAIVEFDGEIHTFHDLGALTVEAPTPVDTPGVWTDERIDKLYRAYGDVFGLELACELCRQVRDDTLAAAQERIAELEELDTAHQVLMEIVAEENRQFRQRIRQLETQAAWEPAPVNEVFRLTDEKPDYRHAIRGHVFYTLEAADGQRMIVKLTDDVRLCRGRQGQEGAKG